MLKYQTTRTIRFKLENPKIDNHLQNLTDSSKEDEKQKENLTDFLEKANSVVNTFIDLITYEFENKKGEKEKTLSKKIKVQYNWLRTYFPYEFYEKHKVIDGKKIPGEYPIGEGSFDFVTITKKDQKTKSKDILQLNIGKLRSKRAIQGNLYNTDVFWKDSEGEYQYKDLTGLTKWLCQWTDKIGKLEEMKESAENVSSHYKQQRRSDIAYLIRFYQTKHGWELINEFYNNLNRGNTSKVDEKIEICKEASNRFKESLDRVAESFLPYQSQGVLLKKTTLNYMTLNKAPKELDKESEDKKVEETKWSLDTKKKNWKEDRSWKTTDIEKLWKILDTWEIKDGISLSECYKAIKSHKSEEKKKFKEAVDKEIKENNKKSESNLIEKYPLFYYENKKYEEYKKRTIEIQENAEKINRIQQTGNGSIDEIKNIKEKNELLGKQRGVFFQRQTPVYKELCEFYNKSIAMEMGRVKASLRAIEKDKTDSQRVTHWAVMYKDKGKHGVLMFPREKEGLNCAKVAKEYIDELKTSTQGTVTLYMFNSLTLRALEKLCFKKENNTFRADLKRILNREIPEHKKGETLKEEVDRIEFYKEVLRNEKIRSQISLTDFGKLDSEVLNKSFATEDEFRMALERHCYVRKTINITPEEKESLIKKFRAEYADITSLDLEHTEVKSPYKKHTQVWFNFWNNGAPFPTRLNPELSIFYRQALKDEEFYREKHKNFYNEKKAENRWRQSQYTLATTILENAGENTKHLAFQDAKKIKDAIDTFNKNLNKNFFSDSTKPLFYGIDRGEKELATLCAVSFSDETYEVAGKKYNKPKFCEFKVWKLKDEYCKDAKILKNISYYINKEDMFEPTTPAFIDLSTAKVINGKIVLNGDITTYYRLLLEAAKWKLFNWYMEGKITDKTEVFVKEDFFKVKLENNKEGKVCFITEQQKTGILEEFSISKYQKKLKDYISKLKTSSVPPNVNNVDALNDDKQKDSVVAPNVNRFRNAVASNVVGILAHLQKNNGKGYIAMENFSMENVSSKITDDSSSQLLSNLEWKVYRKFQYEGWTPPYVKQPMLIKNYMSSEEGEKKHQQIGIAYFVPHFKTSKRCPVCDKEKEDRFHTCVKKKGGCGFSIQEKANKSTEDVFKRIESADAVAAYNIAKKAYEHVSKP